VAALAFRRGLMKPGAAPVTLTLPQASIATLMAQGRADVVKLWEEAGVPRGSAVRRRLEVALADGAGEVRASEKIAAASPRVSDTGEVSWETNGQFLVRAPAVRMAVGKIAGQKIELGDVVAEVGTMERGYACVALVALDGKPVAESKSVLLAAAGSVENQGMGWNADRTSVSTNWGKGPAIAEIVPVTITLPGKGWKAQALDGAGAPRGDIAAESSGATTAVKVGGTTPSLWYLLSR
jgi:hypothetical protein